MFVVSLTYIRPLAEVDALLEQHRSFLERMYDAGVFLLSGRREPRTGGVILAQASSSAELSRLLAEDPFAIHDVASYEIMEFLPTMSAESLRHLLAASATGVEHRSDAEGGDSR